MRVGYLLKKFPRLSETFVLGEILRLEDLGTELVVLARRSPDDEPHHAAFARLRAPIEYLPPSSELDPWQQLFTDATADAELFARLGSAVKPLAQDGVVRLHKLVAEALWVLRRSRELGLEHLHVHFATESAIVAWIVACLGGPTYSITAHAKDIYRSTVASKLLSRLVEGSRFTVTVCDANVAHLHSLLGPSARTNVRRLYNGIDLEDFAWSTAERQPQQVLAVGRLVKKKGFDTLLGAMALLAARGSSARLRILGDGEERGGLIAQCEHLGLQDRVELVGAVDQAEVRASMNSSTVLALPCRIADDGNRDALPTVLLEALAVGLPVVSTPVTGVPEILDGGRCGRLVQADDPEALADALEALLEDAEERERFAERGRAHVEAHFNGRDAARQLRGWLQVEEPLEVSR